MCLVSRLRQTTALLPRAYVSRSLSHASLPAYVCVTADICSDCSCSDEGASEPRHMSSFADGGACADGEIEAEVDALLAPLTEVRITLYLCALHRLLVLRLLAPS